MTDVAPELVARFRSADLAERFVAAYDAELARWPASVTSVDVATAYGTTHVQVCGPPDAPPVVLLHGGGCTSTAWFATAAALAGTHRVYAPDQLGDAGLSVPAGRPIRRVEDFMGWLDGLFDGLGLREAALCGHSYGGWLALNYALHKADPSGHSTITRLALLDPTDCFAGLRLGYRLRALPLFVRPSAARMRAFIEWETDRAPLDSLSLALACLAGGEFRGSPVVMPHRPAADRLAALAIPTLLLLAEKSRAHDIRRVRANAERSLPHLTVAALAGVAHHSLPATNPERLNQELVRFLADRS
ncbi:MAG TPA: alpha/beta hydrolase [Pseudonocardiaceae bacterium]|jgi:pimeloyl-ACP methyl ester carboxylesterase|nr:alpha/beta hydrolase [Pseudonocardiaceae bacterium]